MQHPAGFDLHRGLGVVRELAGQGVPDFGVDDDGQDESDALRDLVCVGLGQGRILKCSGVYN